MVPPHSEKGLPVPTCNQENEDMLQVNLFEVISQLDTLRKLWALSSCQLIPNKGHIYNLL